MAQSVVSFVVERLGILLIEEAAFLLGVNQQVNQIQIELKRMQCFLKDADQRQNDDESVQNWVSEIREAAYDVQDVIETFALEIASKNRDNNPVKRYVPSFNNSRKLHKVGSKIESIKTKISDLTRSLQTYGVTPMKEEGSSLALDRRRQLRWSYSHIVEEYIVGLDENIKEVVGQLVNEDKQCQVVSICGMGGLGKTTLAKKVYHHSDVRRHFDGFAWAYISQQCKTRDVWEGILIKLTSPTKDERDQISKMRDEEVAKKLNQVQKEKRCLVILDDIWSTEAWDLLSPGFPSGQVISSKILLTTRNREVALHIDPSGFLHEPGCLNEEQSWELFQKKAFQRQDPEFRISKDMENIGREMVARCAGLPLAIIVLGGLLATKETLDEWDIVHRNIKSHLGRGRGQQSKVYEVLALSYFELPYQLKPCFLYLSHFPEDFDIPTKKLVRLWVAEGFVPLKYEQEGDEKLEDYAERYLVELINRCMVQVGVIGSNGRIKSCRLHDLMRDLCLSNAKQENFLHILSPWSRNETVDSSTGSIRRLAIYSDVPTNNYFKENPQIRSLIYFNDISEQVKSVFKYSKLLRVLDLEGIQSLDGQLPEQIGSLIHLRFLSLKKTHIRELPSSIVNLVCLETLNLETIEELSWESTVLIPTVIWKMKKLRHLYLPKWCNYLTDDNLQLAKLSNLQTLVNFPTNKCDVRELLSLTNLKKLVLNDPRDFQEFGEIFNSPNKKLSSLRSLSMKTEMLSFPDKVVDIEQVVQGCPRLHKLHIEGRINKLPNHQEFPPYLAKLTLWGSRLVEDPMPVLEKLPYLRVLRGWEAFIGKQMVCSEKGFPQLKSLLLRGLRAYDELPSKNCSDIDQTCGSLNISYPFGTRAGCYMNEDFLITCNRTHYNPPLAFLGKTNIVVTDIWLSGELRVSVVVAQDCYKKGDAYTRSEESINYNQASWIILSKFPISSTRNKFTAIGCDTYALINGSSGTAYTTGCMSLCSNMSELVEGSCSGIGCCQTAIPKGVMGYRINVSSYFNHEYVYDFNPCSYAFVAEEGTYNFSSKDLKDLTKRNETTQVVLNWAIGNQTCTEAEKDHPQNFACKNNSHCQDSVNGPGYWCNCSKGFEGNPYLPNGCQDINECKRYPNLCHKNSTCINFNGTYNCSCLPGYEDDGKEIDGSGCKPIPPPPPPTPKSQTTFPLMNRIALGVSVSLLLLLLGISWLYLGLRQRKHTKLKQKFFEQNGGFMLQQQLSRHKGSVETTRIFTAEELMKATNNYHENRILGQGGQGTVYKGILSDNRIVAIKKSRTIDRSQIEQFINEVIVLSQVNHRNVVKLLGCCLETQVPMLVYEFVTNGTLFNHIHHIDHSSTLQWQLRLQIATETAGALSYLHFAASTPIIHRDIKSTNVLLDDNYIAKVSDFGASRLVPLDQTQLTTLVQGTLGYLDPEYFQSSQLTEKSDVYSFGVLLAELLTGKKALSFDRPEAERNLAMHFVLAMKENRLFEILDRRVLNEGNAEQVMEVAMLVKRCLSLKGEERPTMKEVALELEGLKAMEKPAHVKGSVSSKETEYSHSRPDDVCLSGANSDSACYDSIKSQVKISELHDGR